MITIDRGPSTAVQQPETSLSMPAGTTTVSKSAAANSPIERQREVGAQNEELVLQALQAAGTAGILPGELVATVKLPATTARARSAGS
jgi:hypothetical protein